MMTNPEARPTSQEEVYEWIVENDEIIKVTQKNSKGRICNCCGCRCPCRCACCRTMCCSFPKKEEIEKRGDIPR